MTTRINPIAQCVPTLRTGFFFARMTYRGHVGVAWWEENSRDWQGKVTTMPASCLAIFVGRSIEEAERQFHELVDAFVEEEP